MPHKSSQRKRSKATSRSDNVCDSLKSSCKPGEIGELAIAPVFHDEDESCIRSIYESAGLLIPDPLNCWDQAISIWLEEYRIDFGPSSILEVNLDFAVYVFDESFERVLVAYAISSSPLFSKDKSRMRGFPNVNSDVKNTLGENAFAADRGHFLGHAAGGILDINLFPQRRELNRGWSREGQLFRKMERHAASHLNTFVYHRAIYNDDTWIPETLEFGLLVDDKTWWIERFQNK